MIASKNLFLFYFILDKKIWLKKKQQFTVLFYHIISSTFRVCAAAAAADGRGVLESKHKRSRTEIGVFFFIVPVFRESTLQ